MSIVSISDFIVANIGFDAVGLALGGSLFVLKFLLGDEQLQRLPTWVLGSTKQEEKRRGCRLST